MPVRYSNSISQTLVSRGERHDRVRRSDIYIIHHIIENSLIITAASLHFLAFAARNKV